MILKDNWDLFLLERGRFISIRVDGQDCGPDISRLAEVFPALSLEGKNYLSFEPTLFRFEDDTAGVSIHELDAEGFNRQIEAVGVGGMVNTLKNLFNDFNRIKAECENPFFGISAEEIAITKARGDLARSDTEMARVTEDLVELLVNKGVIVLADLPQAAQDKIVARQKLRSTVKP